MVNAIETDGVGNGTKQLEATIMSTSPPVNQGAVLTPDEDVLYEVVDNQVIELVPMGAYEVWIATVLVARLATFATQRQLGRAVQEYMPSCSLSQSFAKLVTAAALHSCSSADASMGA